MHSAVSIDGEYSPLKLMQLCKLNGLKTVSLTDHNSIKGVAIAKETADKIGLNLISGIELDCQFEGCNLHLLGYGIDTTMEEFSHNELDLLKKEQEASIKRMQQVLDLGIYFDKEKVLEHAVEGVVTGELIAEFALEEKRNEMNDLLVPYRSGNERSDNPYVNFYWDFCAQGKPAYVAVQFISLIEAIQMVKKAGGITIFAHPGANIGQDKKMLEGIIECGVDGIEVYSSYHNQHRIEFYNTQAERFHLLKTLGSDFHGKTKPSIKLGTMNCLEEAEIYDKFMKKLYNG